MIWYIWKSYQYDLIWYIKVLPKTIVCHTHILTWWNCPSNIAINSLQNKNTCFFIIIRNVGHESLAVCETLKCQMSQMSEVKFCDQNLPCPDHHHILHLICLKIQMLSFNIIDPHCHHHRQMYHCTSKNLDISDASTGEIYIKKNL